MYDTALQEIPIFHTVGMLRELLKNYPDNTTVLVDGIPGLFFSDEEGRYINLSNLDSGEDDYTVWDAESPATMGQEYLDF